MHKVTESSIFIMNFRVFIELITIVNWEVHVVAWFVNTKIGKTVQNSPSMFLKGLNKSTNSKEDIQPLAQDFKKECWSLNHDIQNSEDDLSIPYLWPLFLPQEL
jgi:hypothetical protein